MQLIVGRSVLAVLLPASMIKNGRAYDLALALHDFIVHSETIRRGINRKRTTPLHLSY